MNNILKPGVGVLFMKVGVHASETLQDIIARKREEINRAGFAMWGYGGNTCHPKTMVQPFANDFQQIGQTVHLCMQEIESNHFAPPVRADQFSSNGTDWQDIPNSINVLGSRYALVIKNLREERFRLPLDHTEVAVGNSRGRPGDKYIAGRVDKACLIVNSMSEEPEVPEGTDIGLVAELMDPFAVFLRNHQ